MFRDSSGVLDPSLFPFVVLVVLTLAFPFLSSWKQRRLEWPNIALGFAAACLIVSVLAMPAPTRWIGVVALAPGILVIHQMFFLWLSRPQRQQREKTKPDAFDGADAMAAALEKTVNRYYSPRTLFVRYGLPGILLAVTGFILLSALVTRQALFYALLQPDLREVDRDLVLHAARFGLAGAYAYVLIYLGRRAFCQDITTGAALWALVGLLLGPGLAATLALVWRIQPTDSDSWQGGVVLFFAGFAPQRVIAAVEQAALQLLRASPRQVVQARVVPLTQIRGVDATVEQRLDEEGIRDATMLAFADPVRLVRNTAYDMRQILAWMDEALLMTYLPRGWAVLQENGITGAIDLAWAALRPDSIKALAGECRITDSVLQATADRLLSDEQVKRVWVLYNSFAEDDGELPEPAPRHVPEGA